MGEPPSQGRLFCESELHFIFVSFDNALKKSDK
jgi:hypothetical protein